MESVTWKAVALLSLVAAFIALIIGIVAIDKAVTLEDATRVSASPFRDVYPKSCNNLEHNSPTSLYTIRPSPQMLSFQTYCDMSTAGGGWTLVASVHENNIDGKCTAGDRWSSEQGTSVGGKLGSGNWENMNVFGQIEALTSDDYKNSAYFSLNASDVMLWHIPNGKSIPEISSSAFLKYYTTNSFLQQYGGHLQNLYNKKLPLVKEVGGLEPLFTMINQTSAPVSRLVDGWYNYRYDNPRLNNVISDGGGDMYDDGNKISFRVNGRNYTRMTYNSPYFLYANGVEVKSSRTYPFMALAWIGEGLDGVETNIDYFEYQVVSNYGADGRGNITRYLNQPLTQGQMTGRYSAFNVHNAGDPSVCEVYFFYGSSVLWQSKFPDSVEIINWSNTTRDAANAARFGGKPRNIIAGYTLLSKQRGELVTKIEIENVLRGFMSGSVDFKFNVTVPHIITPVTYAVGNNDAVLRGIPTNNKNLVDAGYIQFRAFNSVGLPNALCPGVKVRSNNPEQMCIGGSSTANLDRNECGDFAGWAGIPGDRGNDTAPSSTGKSKKDIESTILIFLR